jgi:hypothetical protein
LLVVSDTSTKGTRELVCSSERPNFKAKPTIRIVIVQGVDTVGILGVFAERPEKVN